MLAPTGSEIADGGGDMLDGLERNHEMQDRAGLDIIDEILCVYWVTDADDGTDQGRGNGEGIR